MTRRLDAVATPDAVDRPAASRGIPGSPSTRGAGVASWLWTWLALALIAFLVVACSGPPDGTAPAPTDDTNDVDTPAPLRTAALVTTAPSADSNLVASHLVDALDHLQLIDPSDSAGLLDWALVEGQWAADNIDSTMAVRPEFHDFASAMADFLTALRDDASTDAGVAALVATRNPLAVLAGMAQATPKPTAAPAKPIVVKGKGRVNTKPFLVAAGDYTVAIAGTGDGNIIAQLSLRDRSDYVPLFNEIKYGKYRYETIIYAVDEGSYFFEMDVDGSWTISLTPFH